MDQGPLFSSPAGTGAGVAAWMCPGRGRPSTSTITATTINAGGTASSLLDAPWTDYVINPWLNDNVAGNFIQTIPDNHRTLVGISDGSSNTIFFGHGQINTKDYTYNSFAIPGYISECLTAGTAATAQTMTGIAAQGTFARDSTTTMQSARRGFGGPFAQGCLMGMGDGTVRLFPYSMPVGVMGTGTTATNTNGSATTANSLAAFLTPTGGESVSLPDT
jgi:hypothetical protein